MNLTPPDAAEVQATACGVASVVAGPGGLTPLQRTLIEALFPAMTGHPVDLDAFAPMTTHDVAVALAPRNLQFRTRGVQIMLLSALVLRPLPEEVAVRVSDAARELCVDEGMVDVAARVRGRVARARCIRLRAERLHLDVERRRCLRAPRVGRVAIRLGRVGDRSGSRGAVAGTRGPFPRHARARRMGALPGTRLHLPGHAGLRPPLLAQHDWVHVLADYGTTVESEIEVFGLIARANDDIRAFSLLAMVISLFETGYLRAGAGLFQSSPGHLTADPDLAVRLSDAMRRGALCRDRVTGNDSIDFLRVDWFDLAEMEIAEARERFSLIDKSPWATAAGSVGPWEPGGISPFQMNAGHELAEKLGRTYDPLGAAP